MTDLVNPDQLTPEEIAVSRFVIPKGKDMTLKNDNWFGQVRQRKFKNQPHLEEQEDGELKLYGLEAESISTKRLTAEIERVMLPLLGKSEDLLQLGDTSSRPWTRP